MGDPNPANNTATDDDLLACDAYTSLVADGRSTPGTLSDGATAWYVASLHILSSYSVEVTNDVAGGGTLTVTVFRGDDGCSGQSTSIVNETSALDPAAAGSSRTSFTASGLDSRYRIRVENTTGAAVSYTLVLRETTLHSASWTTNGSYNTYYAFQNTTAASVAARLILRDLAGLQAGSFSFAIPPGGTASVNTVGMAVPRDRNGTAQLIHDGPPGAILPQTAIANFATTPAYVQRVKFVTVRD
jgi:hypothetical protein